MTLPAFAFPRENEVKLSGERDKIAFLSALPHGKKSVHYRFW
jgi:hypothetical protein